MYELFFLNARNGYTLSPILSENSGHTPNSSAKTAANEARPLKVRAPDVLRGRGGAARFCSGLNVRHGKIKRGNFVFAAVDVTQAELRFCLPPPPCRKHPHRI